MVRGPADGGLCRISGYRGCVAFAADFAPQLGGFASVVLLVAALHNSWEMTAGEQERKAAWRGFPSASLRFAYLNRAK